MKKKYLFSLSLLSLNFLLACKAGNPVVTNLGSLNIFSLNSNYLILNSKQSTASFNIAGLCDATIFDAQISFDDGATYSSLSNYSNQQNFSCQTNGSFSYTIDPSRNSFFKIPLTQNSKIFLIRGKLGDSSFTDALTYTQKVMSPTSGISAGSVVVTNGSSFTLKSQIKQSSSVTVKNSNYTLKAEIK